MNTTPPPPAAAPRSVSSALSNPRNLSIGAVVLGLAGSFGPWASLTTFLGDISVDGFDSDGQLTAILFVVVGIMTFVGKSKGAHITTIVMAALAGLISVIDIADVNSFTEDLSTEGLEGFAASASVGWGLWACLVASAVALAAGLMGVLGRGKPG